MALKKINEGFEEFLGDKEAEKIEEQENTEIIENLELAIKNVLMEISLKPETVDTLEKTLWALDEELGQKKMEDYDENIGNEV